MPENQTAWNSDNQGVKEKINQNNHTGEPRQRNMAQMKEQNKTPEKKRAKQQEDRVPI